MDVRDIGEHVQLYTHDYPLIIQLFICPLILRHYLFTTQWWNVLFFEKKHGVNFIPCAAWILFITSIRIN